MTGADGPRIQVCFAVPAGCEAARLSRSNKQVVSMINNYPATANLGQTRLEIFSESRRAPESNSSEQEAGATDPRNWRTRKAKTLRSNFSACRRKRIWLQTIASNCSMAVLSERLFG